MKPEPENDVELKAAGSGLLRTLGYRNFRIYFAGQLVSLIGTWSQMLAISWLVWRLTGSPLWLGFIGFAMQLPMLILGPAGGAFADRYDRLRAFKILESLCMLQAVILAWLTITGRVELWHLTILSLGIGAVYAFECPVRQTLVMDLAGREDLLNAVSLSSALFHACRMIGPLVAGFIIESAGEGACFIFNAATFLFLLLALFMIDRNRIPKAPEETQPLLESIRKGVAHVWRAPSAKLALLIVAIMAGLGMQYTTLLPVFADDVFSGGVKELGWLMGASGLGSLIGALWLARKPNSTGLLELAALSTVIFSVVLTLFSLVTGIAAALAFMTVLGFCLTLVFSSIGTSLQHDSPNELRGRIMSLYTMTYVGCAPFGSLAAGILARTIGAPAALAILGMICLFGGSIALFQVKKGRMLEDNASKAIN